MLLSDVLWTPIFLYPTPKDVVLLERVSATLRGNKRAVKRQERILRFGADLPALIFAVHSGSRNIEAGIYGYSSVAGTRIYQRSSCIGPNISPVENQRQAFAV